MLKTFGRNLTPMRLKNTQHPVCTSEFSPARTVAAMSTMSLTSNAVAAIHNEQSAQGVIVQVSGGAAVALWVPVHAPPARACRCAPSARRHVTARPFPPLRRRLKSARSWDSSRTAAAPPSATSECVSAAASPPNRRLRAPRHCVLVLFPAHSAGGCCGRPEPPFAPAPPPTACVTAFPRIGVAAPSAGAREPCGPAITPAGAHARFFPRTSG